MMRTALLILGGLLLTGIAAAETCREWGEARRIGELEPQIDEASGIAVSSKFPGRLYHVNDSGDGGKFYITDVQGRHSQPVSVSGFKPEDVEDLTLGECGDGRSCLFIGDIGGNDRRRKSIDLIIVEEVEKFEEPVKPWNHVRMHYPDRLHDAESLAIHPDGTIFLLTKEHPSRLFKLRKEQWQHRGGEIQTVAFVTTLDAGGVPTSMDISHDGKLLLVLTYRHAVEFDFDLSQPAIRKKPRRIPLAYLQQQEAVAYLPDSASFIYTSERVILPAWIMKISCNQGSDRSDP